jgi:hypothetical protein
MLSRRVSLLLPVVLMPLVLTGCGGGEAPRIYEPLRYDYLTPLRLNVAAIEIEQRFVPSGAAPDVSQYDPVPPVRALRAMAEDRLQALGGSGQAVFVIQNATLTRRGDRLFGNFSVELDVYSGPGERAGFAQAGVSGSYTGDLDDLPGHLYDLTKSLMERMNVEFEYQVRHALGSWLLPVGAPEMPVQQQPLTETPLPPSP